MVRLAKPRQIERRKTTKLRRISASFLALAGLAALVAFAALPGSGKVVQAAPVTIEVAMLGAQENPPVIGAGSGFARFTFDEATKVLTYSVTISGLPEGEVTAAHIHRGAVGVNGPIVYNLSTVGFTTVSGSITLTDADVADLKAGNFYVNAHSTKNPGGFARGQINITPEAGIKATINNAVAAWNKKDVQGFLANFTTAGALNEFGEDSIDAVVASLPDFIGDPPISSGNVSNVKSINATTATATVDLNLGKLVERHEYTLLQQGGVWKIDGGPIVDVPTPAGAATVPVQLREFSFSFDKSAVASGNFALAGTNVGAQFHEIALAKIPANANLQELLETEEDVPGFEFIGAVFMAPGESAKMVFSSPLAAGRYAMVCFIPDEKTDTPHAFLGMVSEFNVTGGGSSGGGTIAPPNTGDGGLGGGSGSQYALLVLGLFSLVAAGGLTLSMARSQDAA